MQFEVGREEGGLTLLSFLRKRWKEAPSVKAIKRAIDAKRCMINGRVEYFSTHKVQTNDQIEITLLPPKKKASILTLYEDKELLIIDKPPGIPSEKLTSFPLVHRLDKDTSGVFLIGKTDSMRKALIALFAARKIEKRYLAWVDGVVEQEEWKVDNYLGEKARYQGGVLMGKTTKEGGKRATTTFRTLKRDEQATLVEARPITGRTHQIRVHLKGFGHAVLGDWQYAKTFLCKARPSRVLLHALSIAFDHPTMGKRVEVQAKIPADFHKFEHQA